MSEADIRRAFAVQADACNRLGSPFTGQLITGVGRALDRSTETGRRILDWTGQADGRGDAVALRLTGALHALVRGGQAPELAALYPPAPLPEPETLTRAALAAISSHDRLVAEALVHPPQTNEVGRSAHLMAGLIWLSDRLDLSKFALWELGASAGLNLNVDRFHHHLGGRDVGDLASAVRIVPEWSGAAPAGAEPEIVDRRGCDLRPVDLTDAAARTRLVSFIWPDQPERLARVAGAVQIAAEAIPVVDRADAAVWLEARLAEPAAAGVVRVIWHSVALQYFPEPAQERIERLITAAGAAATPATPLAHLSFEQRGPDGPMTLDGRFWPGGEARTLAASDAHVRWLEWQDA